MGEKTWDAIEKRLSVLMGLCREPISSHFYRTFEDRLFDTCSFCHRPLLVIGMHYVVIKYYSQNELLEEVAVCKGCQESLKKTYSEKSLQALQEIYNKTYVESRLQILLDLDDGKDKILAMTANCSICGEEKEQLSDYFEYASCVGAEIMFYTQPCVVCARCSLAMYNSLSEETRENKHRFFEEHYGFPPPGSADEKREDRAATIWKML